MKKWLVGQRKEAGERIKNSREKSGSDILS